MNTGYPWLDAVSPFPQGRSAKIRLKDGGKSHWGGAGWNSVSVYALVSMTPLSCRDFDPREVEGEGVVLMVGVKCR